MSKHPQGPNQPGADGGGVPPAPGPAGESARPHEPASVDARPSRLEQLEAKAAAAEDRALRYQAELDNFRKRAEREMTEERRYASIGLFRDLLPVLDNVYRAIEAGEKAGGGEGLLAGVRMVAEQLEGVLKRHHCLRIVAAGQPFDPHQHEAIAHSPSAEFPANTVMAVALEGYVLHDRVVRPTQVVVSSGPPATETATPNP